MDEDDDLMNYFNNWTTTTTEEESPSVTTTQSSEIPESYQAYRSDYTETPNYTEQKNYETPHATFNETEQTERVQTDVNMFAPTIIKSEEAVTLTKTREKISLSARMKLVISMFTIILASLIFATAWNFASLKSINSEISQKQITISNLNQSIQELTETYNLLTSDGNLMEQAANSGFVAQDDSNTKIITVNEIYEEEVAPTVPSNWFNEVCEFLSNLFS